MVPSPPFGSSLKLFFGDKMDPLSVTASVVVVLRVSSQLYRNEFQTLYKTYGIHIAVPVVVVFGNAASEYARIEEVVLRGDDREALLFRDSVATECNMTAVAVSVILKGQR